ncbi:alpha/beta fold hydrolase [Nocardia puris]|uniref:alpha/beta hydrolase family protein n=1 Tax=Nocardia puris TaxID=208602 RepID=UPI001895E343|nr:alpha/beta fold hydrolase [Nocardia puris]MBF6215359.1 alpha/beta fold hydrolase [Nocardia puris]MBF6369787.1 alpha/beta fold hydrolase [Nocardia puris]MBF6463446.1 alpha/beta fold hydrolase [Nocardia puris]
MRKGRLIALALFVVTAMVAGCGSDADPPDPTKGDWHGAIEIPGQAVNVGVTFGDDGTATIDIPDQGAEDLPLKDVRSDREAVEFAIPDIPGDPVFKGRYDSETGKITGDFTQSGQSFPLTLERGALAPPARPQEPKPPFPYESEDVTFTSGDITVGGTLTTPEGDGPFPAVVLITGSGPQDRNETLYAHKPFLLVADTLTRAGYAVLRTDDRGVGDTGGDLNQATYDDLANDVTAGIDFLRARSEIDPTRIGLFGHSEGGYLAPMVAARPDSGVAFVVLMAGPAVSGGDVLIEQSGVIMRTEGAPPEVIDRQIADTTEMVALIRAGDIEGAKRAVERSNAALPEELRLPEDDASAQITPYFAALINYDPAPALSALRIPVLAFYGDRDLQVLSSQNEGPARAALAQNPDATVHVFGGLNHLMQPAETGAPSEYPTIETTIDPQVLTFITDWLTQHVPIS